MVGNCPRPHSNQLCREFLQPVCSRKRYCQVCGLLTGRTWLLVQCRRSLLPAQQSQVWLFDALQLCRVIRVGVFGLDVLIATVGTLKSATQLRSVLQWYRVRPHEEVCARCFVPAPWYKATVGAAAAGNDTLSRLVVRCGPGLTTCLAVL